MAEMHPVFRAPTGAIYCVRRTRTPDAYTSPLYGIFVRLPRCCLWVPVPGEQRHTTQRTALERMAYLASVGRWEAVDEYSVEWRAGNAESSI